MPSCFARLVLALGAATVSAELEARTGAPSPLVPRAPLELCGAGAPSADAAVTVLDTPGADDAVGTGSSFGSAREHANAQYVSRPTINSLGNALVFISKPN